MVNSATDVGAEFT